MSSFAIYNNTANDTELEVNTTGVFISKFSISRQLFSETISACNLDGVQIDQGSITLSCSAGRGAATFGEMMRYPENKICNLIAFATMNPQQRNSIIAFSESTPLPDEESQKESVNKKRSLFSGLMVQNLLPGRCIVLFILTLTAALIADWGWSNWCITRELWVFEKENSLEGTGSLTFI